MTAELGTFTHYSREVVADVGILYADEFRALAERLPADDPARARVRLLVFAADKVHEAERARAADEPAPALAGVNREHCAHRDTRRWAVCVTPEARHWKAHFVGMDGYSLCRWVAWFGDVWQDAPATATRCRHCVNALAAGDTGGCTLCYGERLESAGGAR